MRWIATVLVVLMMIGAVVAAPLAADITDTGTITVTGTVPPKGTSISTALSTPTSSVHQGAEIVVSLTYGSSNTASIPLTLQAKWGKGTIDGATEASVDGLEYVVGSAQEAYGNSPPVVDVRERTITWSIDSFPAQKQGEKVSFTVRTNASYTGEKTVRYPLSFVVLSPSGAPDRTKTIEYTYDATAASSSPTPTPTPAPATTATTAASIKTTSSSLAAVRSVRVKALGANSAKVGVLTVRPVALYLRAGVQPNALAQQTVTPSRASTTEQEFILNNLSADTTYYFQLVTAEGSEVSEVFGVRTAQTNSSSSGNQTKNLTVIQQRNVLFSGSTTVDATETVQPIMVTKDSVVDISLLLPNSPEVKSVEVFIRDANVLGASTIATDTDEYQSQSALLTDIGNGVYIGKVRTPVIPGEYELAAIIEDSYGNLTEEILNTIHIVQPFTVTDRITRKPIEHARIMLYVFNENTQLYEKVSNITTVLENPSHTDHHGSVELSLFPAKYKAVVSAPGYETQEVLFTVGDNTFANMPQVGLRARHTWLGFHVEYLWGLIQHVVDSIIGLFRELAKSQRIFLLMLYTSSLVLLAGILTAIVFNHYPHINEQAWMVHAGLHPALFLARWPLYFFLQIVRFCGEFFILHSLIFGVLFFQELSPLKGALIFLLGCLALIAWAIDVILLKRRAGDHGDGRGVVSGGRGRGRGLRFHQD